MPSFTDAQYMQIALRLAARNLGQVWPNPAVGCVIVKDNQIIGRGWTAKGGRPHAETMALQQAGKNARGAIVFVTLEPCSHQGQTPPCVDALIAAGITRVVIAIGDPDPRVNGQGIAKLKAASIEVIENIERETAQKINEGFLSRIQKQRPKIAMKLATSLDGKIALCNGQSQWITGDAARQYGHLLRSQNDAILTGTGTVLADDPMLDCRLRGMQARSPLRIVMDRELKIPLGCKLAQTASQIPVWVYTESIDQIKIDALQSAKIKVISLPMLNVESCVSHLAGMGITRLLVEAGQALSTKFLQSGMVDYIHWFRAPKIIGNDGLAAISNLNSAELDQLQKFKIIDSRALGDDRCDLLAHIKP